MELKTVIMASTALLYRVFNKREKTGEFQSKGSPPFSQTEFFYLSSLVGIRNDEIAASGNETRVSMVPCLFESLVRVGKPREAISMKDRAELRENRNFLR
jgi:hypothetical protein